MAKPTSMFGAFVAAVLFFAALVSIRELQTNALSSFKRTPFASLGDSFRRTDARLGAKLAEINSARSGFDTWLNHLRSVALSRGTTTNVSTTRIGCREYHAGGQSCVFEGISCVDVRATEGEQRDRADVYLLDDTLGSREDTAVPSDNWCAYRYQGADPRYMGPRHWPIMKDTVVPQWSCMDAKYINQTSLRNLLSKGSSSVKWFETMTLVDLDFKSNDHNNHLLKDTVHLLDTSLFQDSLDSRASPAYLNASSELSSQPLFDKHQRHVLLPQSKSDFIQQTRRDLNRLLYALLLRQNLTRLYPGSSREHLTKPDESRKAAPLLEAYPEFESEEKLTFLHDLRKDESVDLVCSARLNVGSKLGNGGHERNCRNLRTRGWELFGISPPPRKRVGQIYFNQPPKRLIVMQRHATRPIENIDALMTTLKHEFGVKRDVEVELISTESVKTAEDYVRTFSRVGVLVTPHGSQAQGQIWQPRHSAVVEIMPAGYTDYMFSLLADSCKVWHYEVQGLRPAQVPLERLAKECKGKRNRLDPCVAVKNEPVVAPIEETVRAVYHAFERLGYPMDSWPQSGLSEMVERINSSEPSKALP